MFDIHIPAICFSFFLFFSFYSSFFFKVYVAILAQDSWQTLADALGSMHGLFLFISSVNVPFAGGSPTIVADVETGSISGVRFKDKRELRRLEAVVNWIIMKSYKGKSCTQVCESADAGTCVQSELDALNGGSGADFKAKYALAGYTCSKYMDHCATSSNCVRWGSPYVHTGGGSPSGHFERGECWGGSRPTVAPCGQKPVDGHHTRLCPCEGGSYIAAESPSTAAPPIAVTALIAGLVPAAVAAGIYFRMSLKAAPASAPASAPANADNMNNHIEVRIGPDGVPIRPAAPMPGPTFESEPNQ